MGARELELAEHGAGDAEPGAGADGEPGEHVAIGAGVVEGRRGVGRVADAEERFKAPAS